MNYMPILIIVVTVAGIGGALYLMLYESSIHSGSQITASAEGSPLFSRSCAELKSQVEEMTRDAEHDGGSYGTNRALKALIYLEVMRLKTCAV